jgi:hypothetical protein
MTNRFVSFLKKAGQVLSAGTSIAAEFFPVLAPFINIAIPAAVRPAAVAIESKVESEVSLMSQAVMSAETMGNVLAAEGISGSDKAKAAAVGIMHILMTSEAMVGKTVADPAGANAAAVSIAGGLADWWNAVDGKQLPAAPFAPVVTKAV